jgi:hypothetical protein
MNEHHSAGRGDVIILCADSLFRNWGFADGDMLEDFLLEHFPCVIEGGQQRYGEDDYGFQHNLLITLVEGFLLPALPRPVDCYRIHSIHSPIRARDLERGPGDLADFDVEVPVQVVKTIAQLMLTSDRHSPMAFDEFAPHLVDATRVSSHPVQRTAG